MKYADIIVPHGSSNKQAIEFITTNLAQNITRSVAKPDFVMTCETLSNSWIATKSEGLFRTDQIIFCTSEPIKNEFMNLFSLFNNNFSVELYK